MSIEIIEVKNKKQFNSFINLPAKIHKGHAEWVPPIYLDDRQFFNPKKNKSFSYCDTILLLAIQNNQVVGRIMGIINHKYNTTYNLKEGRFCFIETYNDFEVASSLISHIEEWARNKGIEVMVGPFGFSDKDPQGLLVEGFDKPVVIATNCNFPFMVELVEKSGYSKKIDLVVYKIDIPQEIPEFYQRIHDRIATKNNGQKLINFTSRKQIRPYIRPVFHLMNETFKEIYGFCQMEEKEMDDFANRYLLILDPKFVKVVVNTSNEVVAFIIGMPDISQGIKKCKGHLIPFGIFWVFWAKRKTKQLNLLLGAIREDYRNAGLDTLMGVSMLKEAKKAGYTFIDSHLELETNFKMHAEMEKIGGEVYKRYRIFKKDLQ